MGLAMLRDQEAGLIEDRSIPIPAEARRVIDRYLQLADDALPARIESLYLVGSIAFGDYRPGQSDIDFVAVTGDALVPRELDRLENIHSTLLREIPKPWFDGIYVTWSDLEHNPEGPLLAGQGDAPFTHEGQLQRTRGFEVNPSTWLTVRNHPLAVRGPSAPRVWHDAAVIRRWNIDNLNSYWQGILTEARSTAHHAAAVASEQLVNWAVVWCVPGVARLHYTITTGDITSKSGACRYALATFPEQWHTVVREALALRNGERFPPRSRAARRRDVLGFMECVIDDANRRQMAPD
jgi:predicted nucleotidyltransferase